MMNNSIDATGAPAMRTVYLRVETPPAKNAPSDTTAAVAPVTDSSGLGLMNPVNQSPAPTPIKPATSAGFMMQSFERLKSSSIADLPRQTAEAMLLAPVETISIQRAPSPAEVTGLLGA